MKQERRAWRRILLSVMASIFNQNILQWYIQVPVYAINYVLVLHDKKDHVFCSSTVILAIKVAVSCIIAKIMNWIKSILHIHIDLNLQNNIHYTTYKSIEGWVQKKKLISWWMALPIQLQMYLKDQASSWKIRNWRQGTCNAFIYSEKVMFSQISHTLI